ncbi:MAG TPA: SDR family NAD(P)-dependent oxidoreductase [Promineifilum sp.]|nr:SDR family NAD(P)-dependent oxidoreductase [Promineifilum sp.]HRO92083.1 SDR family NAD(P)-dependent oxidoreductase [Promineifilum sp.]HRQ12527.1 SDR family NAD(P)-dependent oxidoreductase [Promineifilum sp.]
MTSPVYYPLEPRFRAIVVGASSGLGAALVRQLASQRYHVAAVARREANLAALRDSVGKDLVLPYVHDVTEYEQVPMLFDQITRDLGGLDLIIYCAAVQPPVALHEYNFEKDEAMVTTNFLGAVAWLNQAALRFERARAGHIVGISSIAGDRGRVGSPAYNASKAGLDTYLEALRNRLSRYGIVVTTIKPGFVDTDLLKNAPKTFWVVSPEEAAARTLTAIRRRRQVAYVPSRWQFVSLVVRSVPSFIFRRLSF